MIKPPVLGKIFSIGEIPKPIIGSIVRSLYVEENILLIGMICLAIAPLVLYLETGDIFQIVFSILFQIAGFQRMLLGKQFRDRTDENTTSSEYEHWEHLYFLSVTVYFTLLGSWYLAGSILSDKDHVHLISLTLCLTFMIGIIGRNFGSDKVVIAQVLSCAIGIVSGLIYQGGLNNLLLAAFLIPFFYIIRILAARLRNMLIESTLIAQNNELMTERMNIALDNIRHGIAMFDKAGRRIISNERFEQLAKLGKWDVSGTYSLIDFALEGNLSEVTGLREQIANCLVNQNSSRFKCTTSNGRYLEVDFTAVDVGGIVTLADISESVENHKVIKGLANNDALTDLPNRRHFVDEITRVLGEEGYLQPCSMFFIDLDNFKEVNDTLGHKVGDKLLTVVSSRLTGILDNAGMICRFGGDEFVIVIPGMTREKHCLVFADKIIEEIKKPVDVDGNILNISASIGIATAPKNGKTIDELLQNTDAALYNAKENGRCTSAFYSDELRNTLKMRRDLEHDLRDAIQQEKIEVHFQPLIDLKRGRISTCEALVRWTHPEYGNIAPPVFVGIAEETGSINQLGEYVLKQALLAARSWPDHVMVAVNVSSKQFKQGAIIESVRTALQKTGMPPSRLDLEITETIMLENMEESTNVLHELSGMGIHISLDDFGTGFSSLSYLHSLPFDKIKIDRSFIKDGLEDERSLTLLQGVVELIKRLGMSVVLEGIETEEQMHILMRSVEINEAQGFLFSKPLPPKDILNMLNTNHQVSRQKAKEVA